MLSGVTCLFQRFYCPRIEITTNWIIKLNIKYILIISYTIYLLRMLETEIVILMTIDGVSSYFQCNPSYSIWYPLLDILNIIEIRNRQSSHRYTLRLRFWNTFLFGLDIANMQTSLKSCWQFAASYP